MTATITQIGDQLGIVLDPAFVAKENLKPGDLIEVQSCAEDSPDVENSASQEMDAESAETMAREIIQQNDELFRALS